MPWNSFLINNEKEMNFIYNSLLMGNGTHAALDLRARKCVNAEIHFLGLALQTRAEQALGISNQNPPLMGV